MINPFDWVYIPAGDFLMGSNPLIDQDAFANEQPQHRIHLPEYHIARTPVTIEQFTAFVNATSYQTTAEKQGFLWIYDGADWKQVQGANWRRPTGQEESLKARDLHPVVGVSWHDSIAFCHWAHVRLPSEAEWEKAARGNDGRIYPWGNHPPTSEVCNFGGHVGDTTPVFAYPQGASPYGVLDMGGNVREWLNTQWGLYGDLPFYHYPYKSSDGREAETAPDDFCRCMREGYFFSRPRGVRSAYRHANQPYHADNISGFRVTDVVTML